MELESFIGKTNEGLVIFCGTGISFNSGLPLAGRLTDYILEQLPLGQFNCDK